ncbi:hypothetical protein V6N12_028947 [Hibiscus sabdariffa]|uniref:Uncharacterized protein n=1 Tax=Hibiscus sabdariffa TaxID=183260 RepID=A0ABR2F7E2_9ROSI
MMKALTSWVRDTQTWLRCCDRSGMDEATPSHGTHRLHLLQLRKGPRRPAITEEHIGAQYNLHTSRLVALGRLTTAVESKE